MPLTDPRARDQIRGLSRQPMRRPFIFLLALAQALVCGWTVLNADPTTPCSTTWRVASAPVGGAAAEPREIRARSAYAVAPQGSGAPRTPPRRAAVFGRRRAASSGPAPVSRPLRAAPPSLVLRI
jgi:hypothetical protein